jgi:hypothetical protein
MQAELRNRNAGLAIGPVPEPITDESSHWKFLCDDRARIREAGLASPHAHLRGGYVCKPPLIVRTS